LRVKVLSKGVRGFQQRFQGEKGKGPPFPGNLAMGEKKGQGVFGRERPGRRRRKKLLHGERERTSRRSRKEKEDLPNVRKNSLFSEKPILSRRLLPRRW